MPSRPTERPHCPSGAPPASRPTRLALRLACAVAFALGGGFCASGESVRLLVQSSPLAGSQYYALARLLPQMRVGDRLTLEREPANAFDANAVLVRWQGEKLGYLPRKENGAVAAAMDRGEKLFGRVKALRTDSDPWRRLQIDVFLQL